MYRFKVWHEAAGEYELKHAPMGWDTIEMKLVRDRKLHGLNTDFTLDLDFVKDGFDYISSVYETFGIQANVLIFVYEAQRLNFGYDLIYTGVIAYEKWKVEDFPRKGTANIDFVGFTHKFLNGEDTEVNLQSTTGVHGGMLPKLTMTPTNMHSQAISQGFVGTKEVSNTVMTFMVQDKEPRTQKITFGFDEIETNELGLYQYGDGWLEMTDDNPLFTSTVKSNFQLDIKLSGRIWATNDRDDGMFGDFDTVEFWVYTQKNNEPPIQLYNYKKTGIAETHGFLYNLERKVQMTVEPGDKMYLYGVFEITDVTSPTPTPGNGFKSKYEFKAEHTLDKGSHLKVGGVTTTDTTGASGVLIYEAFDRIVESITGHRGAFYSEFFGRTDTYPINYQADGAGSGLMLFNGYGLRGFPQEYDPTEVDAEKLKRYTFTSFKALYEAMDAIFCLGIGIEKVNGVDMVRVEPREHFYRKDEVAAVLGKVAKLSKSVMAECYYKEISVGYKEWKIEDINGLQEFNATQTWTTPITKTKNRYDATCDIVASGYKIEQIRRMQYATTGTEDTGDDEKNFIVCVVRDGYGWKTATNERIASISGVVDPSSAYNLRINPAVMLRNHLKEFASSYYKVDGDLYFNKGEGNYKVSYTTIGGDVVKNGVSFTGEEVGESYFIPERYEFECELNQFQMKTIRENPYGLIKFEDSSGAELIGFLLEVSYKQREKKAEFKLLRTSI